MGVQLQNFLTGKNQDFLKIISDIKKVINTDSSILITGETGVGKEILAEYIHKNSNRSHQPFIKVGLAALPPNLLESELFGHEKGAYTGANTDKKGLFELANKGTIFLDDIDDFPLELQSKLLRVLESLEILKIGAEKPIKINVRLITATKINLKELVERGKFREDLYYRINVVPVKIPPLRERIDDIPLLAQKFIDKYSPEKKLTIAPEALRALQNYNWPGNVRELRNVIQRIVLFAGNEILLTDLPEEVLNFNLGKSITRKCESCFSSGELNFNETIACLEYQLLVTALKKSGGNKNKASKLLELPLSTLRDKLKKYNLDNGIPQNKNEIPQLKKL